MKEKTRETRAYLINLIDKINKGDYPHDFENWGGADVIIIDKSPLKKSKYSNWILPDPRYVITPFSHELSWLFKRLGLEAFRSHIDGTSKIEFYGRLANMANRYKERLNGKEENEKDLLLAVLHEAFAILEEMEDGEFKYLSIAFGNEIYDDFIDSAEKEGYLGVEESKQFLEEMEKKYNDA